MLFSGELQQSQERDKAIKRRERDRYRGRELKLETRDEGGGGASKKQTRRAIKGYETTLSASAENM